MIKLFASDLDGTLLNILHNADKVVLDAVYEAIESGAHVGIVTGRTMRKNSQFEFENVPVEFLGANGCLILDRDRNIIKHFTLDHAFVEELLRAFPQICFECIGLEYTYVTGSRETFEEGFKTESLFMRLFADGLPFLRGGAPSRLDRLGAGCLFNQSMSDVLAHEICKVNTRVPDTALDRELKAFLNDHQDRVVNAPFNPVMFEITDRSVNKGVAVAWLADYLGIGMDEVAVYGDGGNDLAMLKRFAPYGHTYATSNGSAAAKEAAGNVIGNCAFHAVPRHICATVRKQGPVQV